MARRILGLSKGGLSRLTSRFRLTFAGTTSQIASGSWLLMSFSCGISTP